MARSGSCPRPSICSAARARSLTQLFVSHVGTSGLTPRQFAVLNAVGDADGLSQTDIMMKTVIDRSSISELVLRLVTVGLLVRRRTKTDARPYAVRLTPKGRQPRWLEPAARAADQALLAIIPTTTESVFEAL